MKKSLFISTLVFLCANLFAQTNYEKFKIIFQGNDTTKMKAFLKQWEASNSQDPELYTSALNYYFQYSKQEVLSLNQGNSGKESMQLTDKEGKVAGYLNAQIGYNPEKTKLAFEYIDKGIEKFPDRLDMRFGKLYVLKEMDMYEKFTTELIALISYSEKNQNNWLWTENKKLDSGQEFFLNSIYDYLSEIYQTEDDDLIPYITRIGEATLKLYPKPIEILSMTAISYFLLGNYDKAIQYLSQAEVIDPKDTIVLNNLAQAYLKKGDKEKAKAKYELILKYGDAEAKQHAKEKLKSIKN